jgi:predicted peptidase
MRIFGLAIVLVLLTASFSGDELFSLFEPHEFRSEEGHRMPFRLFTPPGYDSTVSYPLVLWLHSTTGRGTDNIRQISRSNEYGPAYFTRKENQERFPAFVLAPQVPQRGFWAGSWGGGPSPQMETVMGIIQDLEQRYNIDSSRIYVIGKSLGGFGAWAFAAEYPSTFAAAVPICGGAHPSLAEALIGTPVWAFHGARDRTVNVRRSREMVDAIRRAGGEPLYSEYPNVGHDVWKQAFAGSDLIEWMFSQQRPYLNTAAFQENVGP